MSYLTTLALTLALEIPAAALLAGASRRRRAASASAALNLVTHPLATLALRNRALTWGGVELIVAVAEAAGYRSLARLPWRAALLVSGVGNAATAGASLLLQA